GDGHDGPSPKRKQTNNAWWQALDQTVTVQRVSYERVQYAQRWKRRRGDPTVSVHSMSWQSKPVKLRTEEQLHMQSGDCSCEKERRSYVKYKRVRKIVRCTGHRMSYPPPCIIVMYWVLSLYTAQRKAPPPIIR